MLKVRQGAACAVLAVLAGCGGGPPPGPAVYSHVPALSGAETPAASAPAEEAKPAAGEPAPPPSRSLPDNPALAAIGAPDDLRAARLVGKSDAEVELLFGPAQFVRAEKTAEIRQYRASSCILDLFLYRDVKSAGQRVEYAAVRNRDGGKPDEEGCLRALLEAKWLPGA